MKKNETPISIKDNTNNGRKVEAHLDLLEEVVGEFQNSGEPEDKLKQVGYIGLLNAINLYPKQKDHGDQGEQSETSFAQYARNLISGEIRHYIREKNKKVKVPPWLEVINKFTNRILIAYYRQFKKFPDIKELSGLLHMSPEALKETLKSREAVHKVSIDAQRREKDVKESPDTGKIKKSIKRRGNEPKKGCFQKNK